MVRLINVLALLYGVQIAASSTAEMTANFKRINVLITPKFDSMGNAVAFDTKLVLISPNVLNGSQLARLPVNLGTNVGQNFRAADINAIDATGPLDLRHEDLTNGTGHRLYIPQRATVGDVTLSYTSHPHVVDERTPIGGRYETRMDQGGLLFSGHLVFPVPWDGDMQTKEKYQVRIEWELSNAPGNTRAVSSFGEAPYIAEYTGQPYDLWRIFFAVGPLKSLPGPPANVSEQSVFGFYYFGSPPPSITTTAPLCEKYFYETSKFFKDPPSAQNPFRVFLRRVTPSSGWGGAAGLRYFLLDYDQKIERYTEHDNFYLLSHELVHNWPFLGGPLGGWEEEAMVKWYNEGSSFVAQYFTIAKHGQELPITTEPSYRTDLASEVKKTLSRD
jgi:hypothetical protein